MSSESTLRSFGYVACLLVPNQTSFADGDPTNSAFYDVARIASGAWLRTTVAVAWAALLVFYRLSGRGTELSLED
jgi:hypothetical protein